MSTPGSSSSTRWCLQTRPHTSVTSTRIRHKKLPSIFLSKVSVFSVFYPLCQTENCPQPNTIDHRSFLFLFTLQIFRWRDIESRGSHSLTLSWHSSLDATDIFTSILDYFSDLLLLTRNIFSVPVMKVMDGFGRNLADQYYKAGSSLEIVCEVITSSH